MTSAASPRNGTLERRGHHALELGRDMGFPWLASVGHARLGLAAFWRGQWNDTLVEFERAAALETGGAAGGHSGRLLLIHAYLGHRDVALELIDRARPQFPTVGRPASARSWALAATAAEAYRVLGEPDEVGALYPTMSALAATTGSVMRAWDFRLVATLRGHGGRMQRGLERGGSTLRRGPPAVASVADAARGARGAPLLRADAARSRRTRGP